MACFTQMDMDLPTACLSAQHNGLHPDCDTAIGLDSKQEMAATCLTVHLYHPGNDGVDGGVNISESELTYPPGDYVAEELCIDAAKACGEFQESIFTTRAVYHIPHILHIHLHIYCKI